MKAIKKEQNITGTPFANHVDQNARPQLNAIELINNVFSSSCSFGFHNVSHSGQYKLMGYSYNLRPFLSKILVKQYGEWFEYWAPNKTILRNALYGKIDKMIYI